MDTLNFDGWCIKQDHYTRRFDSGYVAVPVASITFSEVDPVLRSALSLLWNHSGTGAERIDLQLNGSAAGTSARMTRAEWETEVGTRGDRTEPGFSIADLTAVAAGTRAEIAIYLLADNTLTQNAVCEVDSYSEDANLVLADRIRLGSRKGRWSESLESITSVSLLVASGRSRIGLDSRALYYD